MIRKNLLKATLITTIIACILTTTACGKKSASNDNAIQETKATVSAETKSNAAKELTKTEDKNDSIVADNSTAETASNNEETNTLESASDGDNSLNEENNNSDENTSSGGSADTGNESDSASDNNDGGNTEENNVSNGGDTDSQPSDNEQGNEETPSPEPEETPVEPEPTPEPSVSNSPYGNEIYVANGVLQYGETADESVRGKDVNTGSDVACPYQLDVMTTRAMYDVIYGYHIYKGYYVSTHETSPIRIATAGYNSPLYDKKSRLFAGPIGEYSCGTVVFTCLGIAD